MFQRYETYKIPSMDAHAVFDRVQNRILCYAYYVNTALECVNLLEGQFQEARRKRRWWAKENARV